MWWVTLAFAGELVVNVAPVDTRVRVDGELRGAGVIRELPAGLHTVELEREGYLPVERRVEVTPGATACLSVTLERVARAEPDPTDATAREKREAIAATIVASVLSAGAYDPHWQRRWGDPRDPRAEPKPKPPIPERPPDAGPAANDVAEPCP